MLKVGFHITVFHVLMFHHFNKTLPQLNVTNTHQVHVDDEVCSVSGSFLMSCNIWIGFVLDNVLLFLILFLDIIKSGSQR